MSYSIPIKDGIITMCHTDFNCPHCAKGYDDIDEKYLNRCNKNKSRTTTVKCECKRKFGVVFNIKGDIVAFELK